MSKERGEPRIISVFNQKGGAGKTTISMSLAGTLGHWGHRVLIVDADPQGTAFRWYQGPWGECDFRADTVRVSSDQPVHEQVRDELRGREVDWVVIDCPPSIESPAPQSALMVSDLALIPVLATPGDIWAVHGALELAEGVCRDVNASLRVGVVPNQSTRTRMSDTALVTLRQIAKRHGVEVYPDIARAVAHQEASAIGGMPRDLGSRGSRARADAEELTEQVTKTLQEEEDRDR